MRHRKAILSRTARFIALAAAVVCTSAASEALAGGGGGVPSSVHTGQVTIKANVQSFEPKNGEPRINRLNLNGPRFVEAWVGPGFDRKTDQLVIQCDCFDNATIAAGDILVCQVFVASIDKKSKSVTFIDPMTDPFDVEVGAIGERGKNGATTVDRLSATIPTLTILPGGGSVLGGDLVGWGELRASVIDRDDPGPACFSSVNISVLGGIVVDNGVGGTDTATANLNSTFKFGNRVLVLGGGT